MIYLIFLIDNHIPVTEKLDNIFPKKLDAPIHIIYKRSKLHTNYTLKDPETL